MFDGYLIFITNCAANIGDGMELIMEKILSFIFPPIVDAYSGIAGKVAVYAANDNYIPFVISNHFLVTYYHDSKCGGFNWPYYEDGYDNENDLNNSVKELGLIDTIINTINKERYVRIVLDHFFIEKSDCFRIRHKTHDCAMVYGYDMKKSVFFIADNFIHGKYCSLEVSFEEIMNAIKDLDELTILDFCPNKELDYIFNTKKLYTLVKSYIDSTCYLDNRKIDIESFEYMKTNDVYGMAVYEILIAQIKKIKEKPNIFDVRTFHVMCNHVNVCVLLSKWMEKSFTNTILSEYAKVMHDKYETIANEMIILRNKCIKMSVMYLPHGEHNIIKKLNDIKKREREILIQLKEYLYEYI